MLLESDNKLSLLNLQKSPDLIKSYLEGCIENEFNKLRIKDNYYDQFFFSDLFSIVDILYVRDESGTRCTTHDEKLRGR